MMLLLSVLLPVAEAVDPVDVSESLAAYAVAVCEADSAEVSWLGIGQSLPGGSAAELDWTGNPCRGQPDLRLRIIEDGELLTQVPVHPGLNVWIQTTVAPRRIQPGEDFEPVPGLVLAQDVRGNPLGAGAWRSRVTLDAGESVSAGMVKRVPDVERGADVTLTVQRGGLRIDAPGRLADDGFLGESVRVVNEATKVVAEGLLIAPDRVRIL